MFHNGLEVMLLEVISNPICYLYERVSLIFCQCYVRKDGFPNVNNYSLHYLTLYLIKYLMPNSISARTFSLCIHYKNDCLSNLF